jgi:hypothetical protein
MIGDPLARSAETVVDESAVPEVLESLELLAARFVDAPERAAVGKLPPCVQTRDERLAIGAELALLESRLLDE